MQVDKHNLVTFFYTHIFVGTAQGLFSVLTAVGNLGPILIGWISGNTFSFPYLPSTTFSLGDALIVVVSGSYLLSGILFTFTAVEEDRRLFVKDST